jgi:hypothetical protein
MTQMNLLTSSRSHRDAVQEFADRSLGRGEGRWFEYYLGAFVSDEPTFRRYWVRLDDAGKVWLEFEDGESVLHPPLDRATVLDRVKNKLWREVRR